MWTRRIVGVMHLEYRAEERWPEGIQFVEDEAGCALNVGKPPAWMVVGGAGVFLSVAIVYAFAAGRVLWRDWRWGGGVAVGAVVGLGVPAMILGGIGVRMVRRHLRFGHLPGIFRLDEVRGVLGFREAGGTRWREDDAGRIRGVVVRDVRLPVTGVVGIFLVIRMDEWRPSYRALFGRWERERVEAFARRVSAYAARVGRRRDDASDDVARGGVRRL